MSRGMCLWDWCARSWRVRREGRTRKRWRGLWCRLRRRRAGGQGRWLKAWSARWRGRTLVVVLGMGREWRSALMGCWIWRTLRCVSPYFKPRGGLSARGMLTPVVDTDVGFLVWVWGGWGGELGVFVGVLVLGWTGKFVCFGLYPGSKLTRHSDEWGRNESGIPG